MSSNDERPRIKLPSFKDVQAHTANRSTARPPQLPQYSKNESEAATYSFASTSFQPSPAQVLPTGSAGTAIAPVASTLHTQQNVGGVERAPQHDHARTVRKMLNENPISTFVSTPVHQVRPTQGSQAAAPSHNAYSSCVGQGNAILVNKNQQGNPILKYMRNINYRHADVIPDYLINDRVAVLFLSLRFHKLQPLYIHGRIKAMQRSFRVFLLCHCDVEDPVSPLADVTKVAIDNNCTLLVGFSPMECARYLEVLKAYEKKPPDAIKARVDTDYIGRLTNVLTSVRAVNRTDVATLGASCHTLAEMLQASEHDLTSIPGLGPTKVKRLISTFTQPFYKTVSHDEATGGGDATSTALHAREIISQAGLEKDDDAGGREDEQREWTATQELCYDDDNEDEVDDVL